MDWWVHFLQPYQVEDKLGHDFVALWVASPIWLWLWLEEHCYCCSPLIELMFCMSHTMKNSITHFDMGYYCRDLKAVRDQHGKSVNDIFLDKRKLGTG